MNTYEIIMLFCWQLINESYNHQRHLLGHEYHSRNVCIKIKYANRVGFEDIQQVKSYEYQRNNHAILLVANK